MQPFFSIIIPVYNVAPYLRECLDSVLDQTFTDWECLCVDDGSTDESGTILNEYAQKDTRFRIFHKKNGGVSAARNLGLDNAKGEYISFLDGDDVWDVSFLSETIRLILLEHPEILRFQYKRFSLQDERICEQRFEYRKIVGNEAVRDWALNVLVYSGGVPLCVLNKRCLGRFLNGLRCAEDTFFMLEAVYNVKKVIQSEYVAYYYRNTLNSATKQAFASKERLLFLQKFSQVVALYGRRCLQLSWFAWFNLCSWCLSHKEMISQAEIHQLFSSLVREQKVVVGGIPFYARPAFYLYVLFNWIQPIRLTYNLIAWINKGRMRLLRGRI